MPDVDEIKKLVRSELEDTNYAWTVIREEDIEEHLLEPFREEFFDLDSGEFETCWAVADTMPDSEESGYLIVYSEGTNLFGLAAKVQPDPDEKRTIVGFYGSFFDSLDQVE